jgi:hypothetical protein
MPDIRVWTKQNAAVMDQLEQNGRFIAEERYIRRELGDTADIMLFIYRWLADHMNVTTPRPADSVFPVWVSFDKEATMMPENGYADVAEQWIAEAPFTEIADHLTMVILSKLPDAATNAIQWIQNGEGMFRYCGFMTLTHLFRRGIELDKKHESIYLAIAKDIEKTENRKSVIMAAYNSLSHYCNDDE